MTNESKIDCYILFPNHNEGLKLHKAMKEAGVKCMISPTPRKLSECCGISLVVAEEDLEMAEKIIEETDTKIEKIVKLVRERPAVWNKFC